MNKVIMLVGGSRSGKSVYAEQIAARLADEQGQEVYYLATATIWDAEFARRVKSHQERRPAAWHTVEEPLDIDEVLLGYKEQPGIYLLDGIGTWVANLMYHDNYPDFSWNLAREKEFFLKVRSLINSWAAIKGTVILVADEVGLAIVPENEQGRIFRDLNGQTNQYLAQEADELYLLTCGIPLQLK